MEEIALPQEYRKRMFTMAGGQLSVSGGVALGGSVIRGTLEVAADGGYVMSVYAGSIAAGDKKAESGMVVLSGTLAGLTGDIHSVTNQEITTLEGSWLQFSTGTSSLYLTANVSDYQKYSVQMELFEFAANVLSDVATPTYEFTVDSGNFIFAREFGPFRNKLELGKGVYLRLGDGVVITPLIIEFELDFEKRDSFSLVFSNRFKRHDGVNSLKDMLETVDRPALAEDEPPGHNLVHFGPGLAPEPPAAMEQL